MPRIKKQMQYSKVGHHGMHCTTSFYYGFMYVPITAYMINLAMYIRICIYLPVPLQYWSDITQAIKYLRRGKQVMSSDDYSPIENLTITRALPLIGRLEVHTCIMYKYMYICT